MHARTCTPLQAGTILRHHDPQPPNHPPNQPTNQPHNCSGLGSLATGEALEQAAIVAAKRAEEDAVIAAAAAENKVKLEEIKEYTVTKKVGADEQLFGSVSVPDILGAVEAASGLTLGSPKVKVEDIKMAGTYDFTIKVRVVRVVG